MAHGQFEIDGDDVVSALTTRGFPAELNKDGEMLAKLIAEYVIKILQERIITPASPDA